MRGPGSNFCFGWFLRIVVLVGDQLTRTLPELHVASVRLSVGLPQMVGAFPDPRFTVLFLVMQIVVHGTSRIAVAAKDNAGIATAFASQKISLIRA